MIPLMIKISQRMVFSGDISLTFASSDYTNEFQPFNIAKGVFGVAAAVFKEREKPRLVFLSVMKACFFFNFVLGGYGLIRSINNFMVTIFLSFAGNSYKSLL
jgi:NTE family protein